jgi:hypothetical protein
MTLEALPALLKLVFAETPDLPSKTFVFWVRTSSAPKSTLMIVVNDELVNSALRS